jgi:hypothetical protein
MESTGSGGREKCMRVDANYCYQWMTPMELEAHAGLASSKVNSMIRGKMLKISITN